MNPATRTASFSARFWAGLLITGQLACGLPAHASDTLRTSQEAETRSAGLEQAVTAGLEEAIPLTLGPEETARFRALAGAIFGSQPAGEDPLDFSMIDGLLREHSLKGTPLFDNGIVRIAPALPPIPGHESETSRSLVTSFEPEAWDPEELGVLGTLPSKKSEPAPVEMGDYFVDEFGVSYRKSNPEGVVVRFRNLDQAAGLTGINPQLELSLSQDEKGRLFLDIRGTSEDLPGRVPAFLAAVAFFAKKGVSLTVSEKPVPLQIGRLDGAGDVASGLTSQQLFVTRGRDILEFDGTTGTQVNLFENIFSDSFDLYRQRLQFDEKRGLLFALARVKPSTYAIYRIRVNAPPGQGIKRLTTETSDDSRVYSPDLAYDPEDETVILMTGSGFLLLDARTGKVKSEVRLPLTRPAAMAYDPRNRTIYLADQNPEDSNRYWITAYNRNGQATGLKIPFKDTPVDMTLDASQQKLFLIGQGYPDRPKLQRYDLATGNWADPIKERLTDPLRVVPFAGGEVLWILDGGWLRPFSMGTGNPITSPTIKSVLAASALLHSDGVFTGGLGREVQGILRTLLERQEITEVYVDQEQLPLSPNAIDTIGEIGVRILREERRFERTGTVLKVTAASPIAPSAGLEEGGKTILLVGSDEGEIGRVQEIVEEVFPHADIQRLPLPLPSNINFRGIDVAVLAEFDQETKETLVQAHSDRKISNLWDEQLDDYELQEALEGFRDAAGLEEPTDEAIGEVIEILWSETDPTRRAQAEGDLRRWLIVPLEQPPLPPRPVSPQDAIRISVKSMLDEIERMQGRRSLSLRTFARMLSKIQSANQDLVLRRPEILPVIRDWFRMESETRARIRERLEELAQTLFEKLDKPPVGQPNVYREETAKFDRPPVGQPNVYREETVADLEVIVTQMKNRMSEAIDRSAQGEEQVSRLMELFRERFERFEHSGDPPLRELPFLGAGEKSGLEEQVLEQWHGMRSAAPELHRAVVSPEVVRRWPAVLELAGMEERLVVDEGPDTVVRLVEAGVESVAYYGGLEEIEQFARVAGGLLSVDGRSLTEGNNRTQLAQILSLMGIPPGAISAGLEELAAGLEELRQAA